MESEWLKRWSWKCNPDRISVVIILQNSREPMLPSALHMAPLSVMESKSDSAIYMRGVISCNVSFSYLRTPWSLSLDNGVCQTLCLCWISFWTLSMFICLSALYLSLSACLIVVFAIQISSILMSFCVIFLHPYLHFYEIIPSQVNLAGFLLYFGKYYWLTRRFIAEQNSSELFNGWSEFTNVQAELRNCRITLTWSKWGLIKILQKLRGLLDLRAPSPLSSST